MVAKYRKKPVIIEAVKFTGNNQDEIIKFAGISAQITGRDKKLLIETLEGVMEAAPGDYIIKGIQGEFYPCKSDIFEATYEMVE